MDNPTFVDEENIPMIHQDEEDYDDYITPDTSRIDETSFIEPTDTTEPTPTIQLRQKVKRDKFITLYKHFFFKKKKKQTLWLLFMDGVQLPQG